MKPTELEKMKAVQHMSQPIGEFLDWLFSAGYQIGKFDEFDESDELMPVQFAPVHRTIEQWLAEMFDIDLDRVEAERRHLLTRLRLANLEKDLVDG